jgi:hypothetical protein
MDVNARCYWTPLVQGPRVTRHDGYRCPALLDTISTGAHVDTMDANARCYWTPLVEPRVTWTTRLSALGVASNSLPAELRLLDTDGPAERDYQTRIGPLSKVTRHDMYPKDGLLDTTQRPSARY